MKFENQRRESERLWKSRVAAVVATILLAAVSVRAETFVVNSTADTEAVAPIAAGKDATGSISLRSAIMGANTLPGADEIVLPVGETFVLTRVPSDSTPGTPVAETGDLDITDTLTIQGNDSTVNAGLIDRVFDVQNPVLQTLEVVIHRLTLKGGATKGLLSSGGAILVRGAGLTLNHCTLTTCTTDDFLGGADNGGLISVNGVLFPEPRVAQLALNDCTLQSGVGRHGGGISAANAAVTIRRSTISGNNALDVWGGAIAVFGHSSVISIDGSLLSQNYANGVGGGISGIGNGAIAINNSTISGNTPGALAHVPGFRFGGSTVITNATITANEGNPLLPGGLHAPNGLLSIKNTIIAANTGSPVDISGTFVSEGYNLIGSANSGVMVPQTGDQVGSPSAPIDPNLGGLADYGGPTHTHALLPGSPAMDAGTLVGDSVDQRGMIRPRGLAPDIGAYESFGLYTLADVRRALSVASGLVTGSPVDSYYYDVVPSGDSEGRVDMADALLIGRKVGGLSANP